MTNNSKPLRCLREYLNAPIVVGLRIFVRLGKTANDPKQRAHENGLIYAKSAGPAFEGFPELATFSVNLRKYVCSCGKVYSQKSSLDRHLRYECGKLPNVPCPRQCGKMFKHKHHVTQHLKSCRPKASQKSIFPNC